MYNNLDVTNYTWKRLFFEMVKIRAVEERIAAIYPEQEMRCPVHLSIGQEAIAVGICSSLTSEDKALSAHRCHAHYLAKGGDIQAMISELYGRKDGCTMGKGGSMHLMDLSVGFLGAIPIVGSMIPVSVGVGFAMKMQKASGISVVFFGDGATEEGSFHESLDYAVLKNLPVLFVCENNFYSVYSPLEVRQSKNRRIEDIARAHGVESWAGNGNDLREVRAKANNAIESIRSGNGPSLILLNTYRWLEHCGPYWDDDLGYRKKGELKKWMEECPIEREKNRLINDDVINLKNYKSFLDNFNKELDKIFDLAKSNPFPDKSTLDAHIYSR